MTKNKFVLPIILLLTIVFVPCAIYGTFTHVNAYLEKGNPKHLAKVGDTLYFYNSNDKLVGTYKCSSKDCNVLKPEIDDEYNTYYKGTMNSVEFSNKEYVFIQDGILKKLVKVSLNNTQTVLNVDLIKNYDATFEDNTIIVKNTEGKYGLFSLDSISFVVQYKYDYMALAGHLNDTNLSTTSMIVQNNGAWYLISNDDKPLSSPVNKPIYDYSNDIIIYKNSDDTYMIGDYNGNSLISDNIKKINKYNELLVLLTTQNEVKVYDQSFQELKTSETFTSDIFIDIDNNNLNVYDNNNNILKTIDLSKINGNIDNSNAKNNLATDGKELVLSAINAYNSEKSKEDSDIKDGANVCFGLSWLLSHGYYSKSESEYTGSVYVTKENNNFKYYYWISNGKFLAGIDSVDENIGGIDYNSQSDIKAHTGIKASSNCGTMANNQDVIYKER